VFWAPLSDPLTPAPIARMAPASAPTEVVNHKSMVLEPGWFNGDRKTFEDWWRAMKLYLRANKVTDANEKIITVLGRFQGETAGAFTQQKLDKIDGGDDERGKRDVYCDKQVEKAVTVLNCVLKDLWEEVGSRGIRKKLKSEYIAYLESKYKRNDGSSI